MARISRQVADFRRRIEPAARQRFKRGWIAGLAGAAGVPPKTLHTLFHRGQKLDAALVTKVDAALGLSVVAGTEPEDLRAVLDQVREVYRLKSEHRREHDWRVLIALLDLPGAGVRERADHE